MATTYRIGGVRVDIAGKDTSFQAASKRTLSAWNKQRAEMERTRKRAKALSAGLASLRKHVVGIGAALTAGLGARAIIQNTKQLTEYASSLVEASRAAGLLPTQLEAIQAVLEQDGIKVEQTNMAMLKMNKAISEAQGGLKTYTDAFDRLNISLDDLNSKSTLEVFNQIADQSKLVPLRDATSALSQLFGRSGPRMLATFTQIRGGMADTVRLADEATKATIEQYGALKNVGGVITENNRLLRDKQIVLLDANSQKVLEIHKRFNELKLSAISWVLDVNDGLDSIKDTFQGIGNLIAKLTPDWIKGPIAEWYEGLESLSTIKPKVVMPKIEAPEIPNPPLEMTIKYKAKIDLPVLQSIQLVDRSDFGFQEFEEAMQKSRDAAQKIREDWKQASESIANDISYAVSSIIVDFDNIKGSFRSLVQSILNTIIQQTIGKNISNWVLSVIGDFSGFSGGGSSGIPHRAAGGTYSAGRPFIAGEHGTELIIPNDSGYVHNNAATRKMMGMSFSPHITIQGVNDPTIIRTELLRTFPLMQEEMISALEGDMARRSSTRSSIALGVQSR